MPRFAPRCVDKHASRRLRKDAGEPGNRDDYADLGFVPMPRGQQVDGEVGTQPAMYIGQKEVQRIERAARRRAARARRYGQRDAPSRIETGAAGKPKGKVLSTAFTRSVGPASPHKQRERSAFSAASCRSRPLDDVSGDLILICSIIAAAGRHPRRPAFPDPSNAHSEH